MSEIEDYNSIPSLLVIILMIVLALVAVSFIINYNPDDLANIEKEEEWLKTADCNQLKHFILEDIEQTKDHNHWNILLAKDLYEWKCEK